MYNKISLFLKKMRPEFTFRLWTGFTDSDLSVSRAYTRVFGCIDKWQNENISKKVTSADSHNRCFPNESFCV